MILLDLFSGIGGFHKGLTDAGFNFKKVYFSEIDKYAIANYRYNYEKAEYTGAVESVLRAGIERPNIVTFGSPCQDFSLAGKRAGLVGERSGLIQEALTIVSHFRPDIFVWENVKGTFSSNNGEDFFAILQAFANIGDYQIEWQLLNTSWLLPQNRQRIYLVGRLAVRCRGEIFPIGEDDNIFREQNRTKQKPLQAEDYSTTLMASGSIKGYETFINTTYGIRRLTEIECERLQGFPDNWTKYGNFNGKIKDISSTQRYKMIGNAVTVKVVEMVGKRILETTEF